MKTKIKNFKKKVTETVIKNKVILMALIYSVASQSNIAFAEGEASAGDKWTAFVDFILPWVQKAGGALVFVGLITYGLAYQNDEPEKKTKGMHTAIAGGIVFAAGLGGASFLS